MSMIHSWHCITLRATRIAGTIMDLKVPLLGAALAAGPIPWVEGKAFFDRLSLGREKTE